MLGDTKAVFGAFTSRSKFLIGHHIWPYTILECRFWLLTGSVKGSLASLCGCQAVDIPLTGFGKRRSLQKGVDKELYKIERNNYHSSDNLISYGVNDVKTTYPGNGTGLAKKITQKDLDFVLNLTKGRIAETLVQELFLLEGFQVYKYGLESNYQGLYKQLKGNKSPSAMSLRVSPDLVVYKNETVTYLEVKFCSTLSFKPDVGYSGDTDPLFR